MEVGAIIIGCKHTIKINKQDSVASLEGTGVGRGRTAPGDTFQGVTPE